MLYVQTVILAFLSFYVFPFSNFLQYAHFR